MITKILSLFIVVCSLIGFANPSIIEKYIFSPYLIKHYKQHYRFLSHAFFHANFLHLFLNVWIFWMFGNVIEYNYQLLFDEKLGKIYFLILFTGGIYASSIAEYIKHKNNPSYASLGASGAIEAVVFSFIIMNPFQWLYFFFIPMPAWILGLLFLIFSFYMSKRKLPNDRIGHEAHFWGAIFGIVFTFIIKPSLLLAYFDLIF
ncbi:MAG TPA: rhomboid family intramembrane serine protease [Bacteroidia bacterium]|nr:rhomboid family intramembrane serine protease [Bacteroidia bacterium]